MSTMGIYGLSGSGIDVESMVRVGMMSKQSQYDKMYQKEIKQEWEKEKFSNVYSETATFAMSTLTDYKMQSTMNAMTATTSNSSAMTVSANGSAIAMSHKIQINALSSNAYLMTADTIARATTDSASSGSINIADIAFKSIEQDENDSTKYKVTDANGNVSTVNAADKAISFKLSDGKTTLSEEESTVYLTYADLANGATLNNLASNINKLGTNIRASYDSVNDSFSLYNSEGGSDNKISISIEAATKTADATPANMTSSSAIQEYTKLETGQTAFLSDLTDAKEGLQRANGWKFTLQDGSDNVYQSTDDPNVTATLESDDSYTLRQKNQAAPTSGFTLQSDGSYLSDTNPNASYVREEDGTYTYTVKNDNFTKGYTYSDGDGNTQFISAAQVNTNPKTSAASASTKLTDLFESGTDLSEGFSFTVNGKTINLTSDQTIAELMSAVNQSTAGVNSSFSNNGYLTLTSDSVGASSYITLGADEDSNGAKLLSALGLSTNTVNGTDTKYDTVSTGSNTAALLNNLGLAQSTNGTMDSVINFNAGETTTKSGSNGEVIIDGKTYTDSITNNRITVGGVTYNLLNTTSTTETVSVSQDTDSIIDKVKSFVEDYNKMLDYFHDLYTETRYSDYKPLTKSQENAMTKEQIEKWNEKAKSGLLYHNNIIGDIISDMREALATPVEGTTGKYNSAFSLGITVDKTYGHITLDESKLKTALSAEPDSVYQVFGKLDDADDPFEKIGVAQRLGDVMNDAMKTIKDYAGTSVSVDDDSTLGNSIRSWQTKMSNFQIQLNAYETLLFKKYDAMESMIQKLSMQLGYVTNQ